MAAVTHHLVPKLSGPRCVFCGLELSKAFFHPSFGHPYLSGYVLHVDPGVPDVVWIWQHVLPSDYTPELVRAAFDHIPEARGEFRE